MASDLATITVISTTGSKADEDANGFTLKRVLSTDNGYTTGFL
jgi:hypothetical protein